MSWRDRLSLGWEKTWHAVLDGAWWLLRQLVRHAGTLLTLFVLVFFVLMISHEYRTFKVASEKQKTENAQLPNELSKVSKFQDVGGSIHVYHDDRRAVTLYVVNYQGRVSVTSQPDIMTQPSECSPSEMTFEIPEGEGYPSAEEVNAAVNKFLEDYNAQQNRDTGRHASGARPASNPPR